MRREWIVEWYHPEELEWRQERPFGVADFAPQYASLYDALRQAQMQSKRYHVFYRVRHHETGQVIAASPDGGGPPAAASRPTR